MSLIVQKFGGTSVADASRIHRAAARAIAAKEKGNQVCVVITVYKDRTFSFEIKSSPASVLLKELVKAEKGSGEPNKNKIGKVTMAQCKAIAKEKGKDLNAFDEDHAARIIAGTARSMGITVEG